MDEFDVSVSGVEQAIQYVETRKEAMRRRLRAVMQAAGDQLVAAAQALAPEKTGALKRSIVAKLTENEKGLRLRVKPSKFYASFLEFGVVAHGTAHNSNRQGGKRVRAQRVARLRASGMWRIKPRPFMGPPFDAMRDRLVRQLDEAIEGAVGSG